MSKRNSLNGINTLFKYFTKTPPNKKCKVENNIDEYSSKEVKNVTKVESKF